MPSPLHRTGLQMLPEEISARANARIAAMKVGDVIFVSPLATLILSGPGYHLVTCSGASTRVARVSHGYSITLEEVLAYEKGCMNAA